MTLSEKELPQRFKMQRRGQGHGAASCRGLGYWSWPRIRKGRKAYEGDVQVGGPIACGSTLLEGAAKMSGTILQCCGQAVGRLAFSLLNQAATHWDPALVGCTLLLLPGGGKVGMGASAGGRLPDASPPPWPSPVAGGGEPLCPAHNVGYVGLRASK